MSIVSSSPQSKSTQQKQNYTVLDEDTYIDAIDKIIQRDFFPYINDLRRKLEWMNAVEENDIEKIRLLQESIQRAGGPKETPNGTRTSLSTPLNIVTEDISLKDGGIGVEGGTPLLKTRSNLASTPSSTPLSSTLLSSISSSSSTTTSTLSASALSLSLDHFQQHHTSEDNASFEIIMEKQREKQLQKHLWLFEKEKEKTSTLALTSGPSHQEPLLLTDSDTTSPSPHRHLILPSSSSSEPSQTSGKEIVLKPSDDKLDTRPTSVVGWPYKAKNDLMYEPEGLPKTAQECLDIVGGPPKEISHSNTRFEGILHTESLPIEPKRQEVPWTHNIEPTTPQLLGKRRAQKEPLHIDLDDFYATPRSFGADSPVVRGYGFVATPSPGPGLTDGSPITTWGRLDSTPVQIREDSLQPGPTFKMPDTPRREKVAHSLVDSSGRNRRLNGPSSIRRNSNGRTSSSPLAPGSPMFSPAQQRLLRSMAQTSDSLDRQLRASYSSPTTRKSPSTPSPARVHSSARSPSPLLSGPPLKKHQPHHVAFSDSNSSLTDNLLDL